MKMIKKLITPIILIVMCICCIVPFAGCKATEWEEIQYITYTTEEGGATYESKCYWQITHDGYLSYDDEEYINAPEENRIYSFVSPSATEIAESVGIYKNKYISKADNKIGQTYYYYSTILPNTGERIVFNSYTIKYVKVRFMPDKSIEIDYDNEIISVKPLSYEIQRFEEEN